MNISNRRFRAGFALIEVLVAVVVLAFGLLALAALQSALIKASSESKAQSVGLALAKEKLDELRDFDGLASYASAIKDEAAVAVDGDPTTAGNQAIGGVEYQRSVVVQRYVFDGAAFAADANDSGAVGTDRNEFKRVQVNVTWTDASGERQAVSLEDAIAALDPMDSAKLGSIAGNAGPRRAKVLITDPGSIDGVIPIALGGGDETAATNPKPVIEGNKKGTVAFVETRFDVLTYAGITGSDLAVAQAKVETVVVGCTCNRATGPTPGYRPTYWDGTRYVAPEAVTLASYGTSAKTTQSQYCDTCCKNHQDATAEKAKFSPYRTDHTHQTKVSGTWNSGVGLPYQEACRLIRVNGILDVATDPSNDFYNLVPTADDARERVPSTQGEDDYEEFVLNYLNNRYVLPTPGAAEASATFNNRTTPSPLSDAAALDISAIALGPVDQRYLHSRGLYLDYLEPSALAEIENAKKTCKGVSGTPTADEKRNCVLRKLPFTSINLTEIAEWAENPRDGRIVVDNVPFKDGVEDDKGGVEPITNASGLATAWTTAGHSASGLTGNYPWAINQDEEALALEDDQEFALGEDTGTTTERFFVAIDPGLKKEVVTSSLASCSIDGGQFRCAPRGVGTTLGGLVPLSIKGYSVSATATVTNPCQTNKSTSMDYWSISSVARVYSTSLADVTYQEHGTDLGAYTTFDVDPLSDGETVTVELDDPTYKCPASYQCLNNKGAVGSGGAFTIADYSDTFAACPADFTP